ncbi:hypothetical protein KKJ12_05740 [Xenorhabdus bovienii]|uniref:hypothetical protein n=1 Tax=Xenorhabdus bovienii TaxID=40576 RepID=UPI0023B2AC17|nr:hypothetical protein [Xenorhabdus bovienii]MDE9472467.1 hypothetical protein [Xenorhabdus bovienii]
MLDNEKQITAFRALSAEGLHPPVTLAISKSTADKSTAKAAYLGVLRRNPRFFRCRVSAWVVTKTVD